ncbi:MAG TPA: Ig-like domain-containing protein, partial [Chitinophaga sp.]
MKRTFSRRLIFLLLLLLLGAQRSLAVSPYPLQGWIKAYMPASGAPHAAAGRMDAPHVTAVYFPWSGQYFPGERLDFYVDFSENTKAVLANGTPYIELTIGSQVVHAVYTGISAPDELIFSYTVQEGDFDDDGIAVGLLMNANPGALVTTAGGIDIDPVMQGFNPDGSVVYVSGIVPTVTLTPTLPAIVSGPFTVTATFSESMSDIDINDFSIVNGSASNFTMVGSDNTVFTVLVTPAGDGNLYVSIPAGAGKNTQQNDNKPSNQLSTVVDQTSPVISDVKLPPDDYYKATRTLSFKVDFSENVFLTGPVPSFDIHIGSQTVQASYISGAGSTQLIFTYAIQPGQDDMDGITLGAVMNLNGGAIKDDAGNDVDPTLNNVDDGANVRVNTTHPGVTLATTAPPVINGPYPLTAVFTEAVYGLIEADFAVVNGNVTNLQSADNIHYTFTITPATPDMPVTVSLPVDVARNIGHNGNLAATNSISVQFDPTPPAIVHVSGPPDHTYLAAETMDFVVAFSEKVYVTGTPTLELNIGGNVVPAAYLQGSGDSLLTFRYTVADGDNDPDGVMPVGLLPASGAIRDQATNNAILALQNIDDLTQVLVNTQHPTVLISGPAQADAGFPVTIQFSEAMGSVNAGDFVLGGITGAALQALSTLDNIHYTATVLLPPAVSG